MACRRAPDGGPRRALLLLVALFALATGCVKKAQVALVPEQPPPPLRRSPPAEPEAREVKPPAPSEPTTAPEIQAQAPRLLPGPGSVEHQKSVEETLARVDRLTGTLVQRTLTDAQREERDAGVTFSTWARDALRTDDLDRAAVLAEKALALIEHVETATRP